MKSRMVACVFTHLVLDHMACLAYSTRASGIEEPPCRAVIRHHIPLSALVPGPISVLPYSSSVRPRSDISKLPEHHQEFFPQANIASSSPTKYKYQACKSSAQISGHSAFTVTSID